MTAHHPTTRPLRARTGSVLVLALLVAGLALTGLGTVALDVAARTTPAAAEVPVTIEDLPHYAPQTTCSPRAKRGTLRVAAWLQRTYPGTGSSGISRACGSGGTSEHKEGRAFDWRVDVTSARDRRQVADFLARVAATDAAGNVGALGRRMGIMYLIWDDRIYSAHSGYTPERYLHSGCRTLRRCSRTLRHRDHLHLSLSWRGARARTSWFTGVDPGQARSSAGR